MVLRYDHLRSAPVVVDVVGCTHGVGTAHTPCSPVGIHAPVLAPPRCLSSYASVLVVQGRSPRPGPGVRKIHNATTAVLFTGLRVVRATAVFCLRESTAHVKVTATAKNYWGSHAAMVVSSISLAHSPSRAVGVAALPCPGGQVACVRPTAQLDISHSRLAAERIFSMSGPLSLFCRGPRVGRVRRRRPRGPEIREDAVTDCACCSSKCRFSHSLRPCGLWASMRHPVSLGERRVSSRHRDGVTSSRFGATVFYWRLAVSVDSQYSIVVHALELRANLSCVYSELIRRATTVAVMRPAHYHFGDRAQGKARLCI